MTEIPIYLSKRTCDLVKFISALLVLSSHVGSVALGKQYASTHWMFYVMATQNGYIGVAIFFFLSGYGLMESNKKSHLTLSDFISRRLMKIYLPVVLVSAIWIIIAPPYVLPISCKSIFYRLLWGFADPVMWFIRVLIPLYIAFYLFTVLDNKIRTTVPVWILLTVCVVYSILSICYNDNIIHHSVPMFALGVMTSYYKDKGTLLCVLLICGCGVPIGLSAFLTSHPLTGFIHCYFDYILIALMVLVMSKYRINKGLPTLLTTIIFDIYLVHFKLLEIGSRFISLESLLICILPVTLIVAWCFMRLRTALIDNRIIRAYERK